MSPNYERRSRPPGPGTEGLVCRPGSVPGRLAASRSATIHLGPALPSASCGPPAHSGGQPSSVRCSTLLRAGFAEPTRSPGSLVVSCTTVSPLPPPGGGGGLFSVALSRGLPRVGVAHRPALRSPDLPRRMPHDVRRGRPTNPSASAIVGPSRGWLPAGGTGCGWERSAQLTVSAVSSITKDVCRETSSRR